jgi:hypothetical protein
VAKRNRDTVTRSGATSKLSGIRALKLALKEPVELGVPRRLLAVLDAERVGLLQGVKMNAPLSQPEVKATYGITRLLYKNLGQTDHGGGAQALGKVHHKVCVILLVTWASAGEKGTKSFDCNGVALLITSRLVLTTDTKR